MEINKVKIINKKTGAVKTVKKSLAADYIGTKEFEILEENQSKVDTRREEKVEKYVKNRI